MNTWRQSLSEEDGYCVLECTVVSGFEQLAKEECLKKLGVRATYTRGRIAFELATDCVEQVLKLKSVDNVYVVIQNIPSFEFSKDKVDCLNKLNSTIDSCLWEKGLTVWQKVTGYSKLSLAEIKSGKKIAGQSGTADELAADELHLKTPCQIDDASSANEQKHDEGQSSEILKSDPKKLELDLNLAGNEETEKMLIDFDLPSPKRVSENSKSDFEKLPQDLENSSSHDVSEEVDKLAIDPDSRSSQDIPSDLQEASADQKSSSENRTIAAEEPDDSKAVLSHKNFKFRVTCNRSSGEHSFGSPEAAGYFGSAVQTYYSWKPDMTQFDLEVVLNVSGNHVHVSLALTRQSLHKRDITCFGKTTLRSTIAYNMLQLARIRDGDVVCDPMCGTGVIPVEGALAWTNSVYLCGDIDEVAPEKTLQNVTNYNEDNKPLVPLCLDIFRWDATCLPLKTGSGKKFDNRKLYPSVLFEMARVAHLTKGRAVVLTHDKRSIIQALQKVTRYWRPVQNLTINIGGLAASVYYLERRSNAAYVSRSAFW